MVRFGLIGSNIIVEEFIAAGKQLEGFALKAIYSRTMDHAREFGGKHGATLFFDDLDCLATCEEIDAVYVASPNFLHKEQSLKMLKAGKHVFCEKPAGVNVRELEEMVKVAREHGVIFMEGMRITMTPNFQTIKENLKKLGPLRRVYLSYCQYSSRYDKFKKGVIENAFKPEMANGALMDLGIYPASALAEIFGLGEVVGASGTFLSNGVDGAGTALIDYGEMKAEITYSKIANGYDLAEFQGEEGYMIVKGIHNPLWAKIVYRSGYGEEVEIEHYENDMVFEVQAFIDLVESGGSAKAYNERSRNAITMVDQIREELGIVFPNDLPLSK